MNLKSKLRAATLLGALAFSLTTACKTPPCCQLGPDQERETAYFKAQPDYICPGEEASLQYEFAYGRDGKLGDPCDPANPVMQVKNQTEGTVKTDGFAKIDTGRYKNDPAAGSPMVINEDSTLELIVGADPECPVVTPKKVDQKVVNPGDHHLLCCKADKGNSNNALAQCSTQIFSPSVKVESAANVDGPTNANPSVIGITHGNVTAASVQKGQQAAHHHGQDANGDWFLEVKRQNESQLFFRERDVCVDIYLTCTP